MDLKACIIIENEDSEWLFVNVGVRQGWVMLAWISNLYVDGQTRTVGRGAQLMGDVEEK